MRRNLWVVRLLVGRGGDRRQLDARVIPSPQAAADTIALLEELYDDDLQEGGYIVVEPSLTNVEAIDDWAPKAGGS